MLLIFKLKDLYRMKLMEYNNKSKKEKRNSPQYMPEQEVDILRLFEVEV